MDEDFWSWRSGNISVLSLGWFIYTRGHSQIEHDPEQKIQIQFIYLINCPKHYNKNILITSVALPTPIYFCIMMCWLLFLAYMISHQDEMSAVLHVTGFTPYWHVSLKRATSFPHDSFITWLSCREAALELTGSQRPPCESVFQPLLVRNHWNFWGNLGADSSHVCGNKNVYFFRWTQLYFSKKIGCFKHDLGTNFNCVCLYFFQEFSHDCGNWNMYFKPNQQVSLAKSNQRISKALWQEKNENWTLRNVKFQPKKQTFLIQKWTIYSGNWVDMIQVLNESNLLHVQELVLFFQ